ncbi:MAG: hypothetical protein JWP49_1074, partial [Phenylobacterium sp.]|nr:hypothetical protein [Phenylobacterium sp.]
MNPTPEADIAAPRDPAEYRPRPLMGLGFWAAIAFVLVGVLAGVAVAVLAPRLWAQRPAARHAEPPAATDLPHPVLPSAAAPETALPPPAAPEPAAAPQVEQLS